MKLLKLHNIYFVIKNTLLCIILAGLYGIIHDQITFTISTEYFTKFKYEQFGLDSSWFGGHRYTVGLIGFLATWWVGFIIGFIVSIFCILFRKSDEIKTKKEIIEPLKTIFFITAFSEVIGYLYGKYYLSKNKVDWWMPSDLIDRDNYILVGSIHNFAYLGCILGLIIALFVLIKKSTYFHK
ncbi:MAG: hypothetical protein RLZZ546_2605 [Bacteroidota bacterium]